MNAKPTMMLAFLALASCARSEHAGAPRRVETAPGPARGATARAPAPMPEARASPSEALSQAELSYQSQLGATRGERFELDRQLTELRRAKLLYQEFLDHAEGHPELEAAARKSRERIKDVQDTIDFLEPKGAQP